MSMNARANTMTAKEAIEYLGIDFSYGAFLRLSREGKIPCFFVGQRAFFRKDSLDKWLHDQEWGKINQVGKGGD